MIKKKIINNINARKYTPGFYIILVYSIEFWLYLRDAVIYKYMKTEDGRKYLENCWRVEQTKPDRQAIRRRMEKD